MTITAYPLAWPTGWKRTAQSYRVAGRFSKRDRHGSQSWATFRDLTINEGTARVMEALERMGMDRDDVVISTNLQLRLDGLPRSNQGEPGDPGVAVYWGTRTDTKVMAIDLYDRVADNLAAVAATLEALRAIERHGGAAILDRAFTGFAALPAPGAERPWWEVLEVPRDATRDEITAAHKRLSMKHHPDRPGGSHERMAEINTAREKGLNQ